jgi:hypothetical protein
LAYNSPKSWCDELSHARDLSDNQGYKVVAIDNRPEPIALAKALKYPPDIILNSVVTSADAAVQAVDSIKGDKPFPGLDGT